MYLFTGIVIWLMVLVLAYLAPKVYPKYATNPQMAKRDIDGMIKEIYRDFERNPIGMMAGFGVASAVLILFWPLFAIILGLATLAVLLGGVPYLIIRRLRKSIPEPQKSGDNW